jgi:protoheme IX farnesyltransferase
MLTLTNKDVESSKPNKINLTDYYLIISELTKIRITFFVSVTTFVGYLLYAKSIDFNFIIPTIGVLFLACGASSFNEYQERNLDALMVRTKGRPLPSGRISENSALLISVMFVFFGSLILLFSSINVFILGIFTLLWYNLVYTPLKSISAFAILPGALVGALPPIIGWAAAGGNIFDYKILTLAIFMFVWQIPHFWLLLLMYDKEYKQAGFPTLSKIFTNSQIVYITFAWIVILVLSSGIFYFAELIESRFAIAAIVIFGLLTLVYSLNVITKKEKAIYKKSFLLINLYVLLTLIIISAESII